LSSAGSKMSHITVCMKALILEKFYWIFCIRFYWWLNQMLCFTKALTKLIFWFFLSPWERPLLDVLIPKTSFKEISFLKFSNVKLWPPNKRCSLSPTLYIPCQLSFATVFWDISYVWCKVYWNLFNQCYYLYNFVQLLFIRW